MKLNDEDLHLLSDFNSWNEGQPQDRISIFDYLCFNATPDLLFGFAALFFCELIKVEGHWFIQSRFDHESYERWKNKGLDVVEIQRVMNHIHIRSLLQQQPLDDSLAMACAQLIKRAWDQVHKEKMMVAEVHGGEDISVTLVSAS